MDLTTTNNKIKSYAENTYICTVSVFYISTQLSGWVAKYRMIVQNNISSVRKSNGLAG